MVGHNVERQTLTKNVQWHNANEQKKQRSRKEVEIIQFLPLSVINASLSQQKNNDLFLKFSNLVGSPEKCSHTCIKLPLQTLFSSPEYNVRENTI